MDSFDEPVNVVPDTLHTHPDLARSISCFDWIKALPLTSIGIRR